MDDTITVTFDATDLDLSDVSSPDSESSSSSSSSSSSGSSSSSSSPDINYSDVSSDDDVPPPPSGPHPDVVRLLADSTDKPEYQFERPKSPVPSVLITTVQLLCQTIVPAIMVQLQEEAVQVKDSESFLTMLDNHRVMVTGLIRRIRAISVRSLKDHQRTKSQRDNVKFSLYKRVAVWRDEIDSVIQLAGRSSGWSETRRHMLWRRLVAASRWRMICIQLRDTYSGEDVD